MAYYLDLCDLFLSKAAAGREKDREFCIAMLQHAFVTQPQVLALIHTMPLDDDEQTRLRATINRWARVAAPSM